MEYTSSNQLVSVQSFLGFFQLEYPTGQDFFIGKNQLVRISTVLLKPLSVEDIKTMITVRHFKCPN